MISSARHDRRRPIILLAIMAVIAATAAAVSMVVLYRAAIDETRIALAELSRYEARTIKQLAGAEETSPAEASSHGADLALAAFVEQDGFGSTGDFILGKRSADMIVFLAHQRRRAHTPEPMPMNSVLAEPMRRALMGQSGTWVGRDYSGVEVLAAFTPLEFNGWALVAKIDMAEIRAPFLKAGAISGGAAIVLIFLGSLLFGRVSNPMVDRLEWTVSTLNNAQRMSRTGSWGGNVRTKEFWCSDETYTILGLAPQIFEIDSLLGLVHVEDQDIVRPAIIHSIEDGVPLNVNCRVIRPNGIERTIHVDGEVTKDAAGVPTYFNGTVQDITEKRQAEEALRQSEEVFRSLAESSAVGIWQVGLDDRTIYVNPAMCSMLGVEGADQVIGKSLYDFITPLSAATVKKEHPRHNDLRTSTYEAEIVCANGDLRPVLISGGPVLSIDGSMHSTIGTLIDNTERKQADRALRKAHDELELRVENRTLQLRQEVEERRLAEAALRESEQRFRDVAEAASDWIWEMDQDLRFTYVSVRIRHILGIEPSFLTGKSHREHAVMEDNPDAWARHLLDLDHHQSFRDFRYNIGRPDGIVQNIKISGKPTFNEAGAFQGYRGTGTNITAEVEAEDAVLAAMEEAELANRAKSEFLANMSHELRTPLNAIIGFSDLTMHETFGPVGHPRYVEYARNIQESGNHLLDLINDILDVSAIEAGKLELQEDEVEMAMVAAASVRLVGARAEEKKLRLINTIGADTPILFADERRLKQILVNLLANAVKFTPDGGQISLDASVNGDGAMYLEVADNGIGMSKPELAKAMQPFGRINGNSDSLACYEGTGLGLPLTKGLVAAHGGTMAVDSAPNAGTTVTICFPRTRVGTKRARTPAIAR